MHFASTITPNYMHSQHAICNNENNYDKLWGYMIFRPRLTKYRWGCVTGGVDAHAVVYLSLIHI